jgi:uncharacterized protein (DUF433 family)
MNNLWTIREAAAIADIPVKTIRQMIEREGLKPEPAHDGKPGIGLLLSFRDMVLLKLLAEFPFALEKKQKSALVALLRGRRSSAPGWDAQGRALILAAGTVTITVDYASLHEELARNSEAFLWGQRRIVSGFGALNGEPVFRGTQIPLAQVERSIRDGAGDEELVREFPALGQTDLDYARIHARLGNRPGRPRKPLDLRRTAEAA